MFVWKRESIVLLEAVAAVIILSPVLLQHWLVGLTHPTARHAE